MNPSWQLQPSSSTARGISWRTALSAASCCGTSSHTSRSIGSVAMNSSSV